MGHATPVFTSVSPSLSALLRSCWAPSPGGRLSRPRSTTGPPPRPGPINRPCVHPVRCAAGGGVGPGEPERFPRSSANPSTGSAPSYAPAPSPRLRRRPSPWPPRPATSPSREVPRQPQPAGARCDPTHVRQVSGRWFRLEERSAAGSLRMPLRLASRARPIWQYWNDSSLSRTAPPTTPTPRQSTVLQLPNACCDRHPAVASHHR